jgi:Gpi18-like mannosyltransferase
MKFGKNKYIKPVTIGLLIIVAVIIRVVFLNFHTSDYDIFLQKWYHFITLHGKFRSFASNFYNYTPPYLYLLSIATLFRSIPSLWAIKIISVLFDFFSAFAVYKIILLKFSVGIKAWLGFILILFTPIVFVQSGLWGQCDIIYTSFLLWSLYYLLKDRYFLTVLFFSIAFAFKLQAIFFAPLLLILLLNKKIRFYWLFSIIGIYLLAITPAWIAGRSITSLLTIYLNQFDTFNWISMKAPNPYALIQSNSGYTLIVYIGIAITLIATLAYIFFRWKIYKNLEKEAILFDATLFTLIIPFLLPKMHERFFFPAGVFIIILAVYNRKYMIPAILLQVSSILSYLPFLFGFSLLWVKLGAVINTVIIGWLILYKIRDYKNDKNSGTVLYSTVSREGR